MKIYKDIIYLIYDYYDYKKYFYPEHKNIFQNVLKDIEDMANIMPTISANIAWQCWGGGVKGLEWNEVNIWSEDEESDYENPLLY